MKATIAVTMKQLQLEEGQMGNDLDLDLIEIILQHNQLGFDEAFSNNVLLGNLGDYDTKGNNARSLLNKPSYNDDRRQKKPNNVRHELR